MKLKYKIIDVSTLKEFKRAERLVAMGWRAIQASYTSVLLERENKKLNKEMEKEAEKEVKKGGLRYEIK